MWNVTVGLVVQPPFVFQCFLTLSCGRRPGTHFKTVCNILTTAGANVTPVAFARHSKLQKAFREGKIDVAGFYLGSVHKMYDTLPFLHDVIPAAQTHLFLGFPANRYYKKKRVGPLQASLFKIISYEVILISILTSVTLSVIKHLLSLCALKSWAVISGPLILIISQYYSKLSISLVGKLITIHIALPLVDKPMDTLDELSECLNTKQCYFAYSSNMTNMTSARYRYYLLYLTGDRAVPNATHQNTSIANAIKSAEILDIDSRNTVDLGIKVSAVVETYFPIMVFLAPDMGPLHKLDLDGLVKWVDFTASNPSLPSETFFYVLNNQQNKSQYKQIYTSLISGSITNLNNKILRQDIDDMISQTYRQYRRKTREHNLKKGTHTARPVDYLKSKSSGCSSRESISIDNLWNSMGPVFLLFFISCGILFTEIIIWMVLRFRGKSQGCCLIGNNCLTTAPPPPNLLRRSVTNEMDDNKFKIYITLLQQLGVSIDENIISFLRDVVLDKISAKEVLDTIVEWQKKALTSKFNEDTTKFYIFCKV